MRALRALAAILGIRHLLMYAGKLLYPPAIPRVRQLRIMGFELLALVNEDVGRRMAMLGRYETRDASFLAKHIRNEDICLDVGANTGFYTMLMARTASDGQIHAFEPVRINKGLLDAGVALNGYDNVVTNNTAVGAVGGEVEFSQSVDGAYSSLVAVGRQPQLRHIRVMTETIDEYTRRQGLTRIDVIKIDVEGAEGLVIDGAARFMEIPSRRPRIAMIELSSANLAAYQSSIDDVVGKMNAYGYQPFVVVEDGRMLPYTGAHHDRYANVFFLQSAPTSVEPD